MKFSVKCNQCGHTFIAETEAYGRFKYRCPYCSNVLTCQFDPPEHFKTKARSVIPLADTELLEPEKKKMPLVKTTLLKEAKKLTKKIVEETPEKITRTFLSGSRRIERFRAKYSDADLWLFFGFSFSFLVLVFVGLWGLAELSQLVTEGSNWVNKTIMSIHNAI